ncbi:GGDEF domain-containing protein [Wukongibacter sp. M2B1]|uniref:GGDEF domain-containing protein n=1 Tax=Wukongibacter sp. M2B1 TaxID=3088895 RepID=UPI003D790BF7
MRKSFKLFYLMVVLASISILVFYSYNSSVTLSIQSIILIMIGFYLENFGCYHQEENVYASLSFSITILIIFICGPLDGIISVALYHTIIPIKQDIKEILLFKDFIEKSKKIIFNICQGVINVYVCDRLIVYLDIDLINTLDVWKIILATLAFCLSNTVLITLIISLHEGKLFSYIDFIKRNYRTMLFSIIITPMVIYNYYDRGLIGLIFTIAIIYSIQNSIIVHRRWIEQEKELFNDGLTDAYNYKYFQNIIDKKLDTKEKFTLLMIDLDDFKEINDTYGHLAGDFVLKSIVNIINDLIGSNDIVCRYGGDEFCIILNLHNDSSSILENVSAAIENFKIEYEDQYISVKSSIGFYNYDGGSITKDELIKKADKAMYRAKHGKLKVNL